MPREPDLSHFGTHGGNKRNVHVSTIEPTHPRGGGRKYRRGKKRLEDRIQTYEKQGGPTDGSRRRPGSVKVG